MNKQEEKKHVGFQITNFCCNAESFGEICVHCGLCNKPVGEMRGAEYRRMKHADKIFNR